MKKILISFVILICFSCKNKIEDEFCECIYKSYNLNEVEFNTIFKGFEDDLIEQKVLKDNSSNSYYDLIRDISNGYDIYFIPSEEFTKFFNGIKEEDLTDIKDCYSKIKEKKEFENSNLKILGDSLSNVSEKSSQKILDLYLKIIPKEDLTNNYHKYKIFFTLLFLNQYNQGVSNLDTKFKNTDYNKKNIYNTLDISLTEKNEILINSKKINVNDFRQIVYLFEKKNKSTTEFKIHSNGETSYAFYFEVENYINAEIEKLKNEIAINEYKKEFYNLSSEVQKEINVIYPKNISNIIY